MKCCQLNTIYKGSKSAKAYYKPKHRTVKMWSLGENKKKILQKHKNNQSYNYSISSLVLYTFRDDVKITVELTYNYYIIIQHGSSYLYIRYILCFCYFSASELYSSP